MISRLRVIFLAALLSPIFYLNHANAVTSASPPQGITVSPAFQQVNIPAGASSVPITFTITNNRPVDQVITLSVQDFNALNESGGLFFVGTNPTDLQKKYGLAKWVNLPTKQLIVLAKQTVKINASILNLPDLSAGGHYGALMLSLGTSNTTQNVGIHPIASSLLFVTKPEGALYKLSLTNVYVRHSLTNLPSNVLLRFYNPGNTHVVPRGVVTLISPSGHVIKKGIINENSNLILPGNYRQYTVDLPKIDKGGGAGNYKLRIDYRFDGFSQYRSYQQSMFYMSLLDLIIILLLVLFLITIVLIKLSRRRRKLNTKKHKIVILSD